MMIDPFRDNSEPTKAEKVKVLENDRRVKDTFYSRGQSQADLEAPGGRFAPSQVPPQPPTSPWACDPVPPEQPIGIDISYVEPTGTLAEQQQAAELLEKRRVEVVGTTASGDGGNRPEDRKPAIAPIRRRV